MIEEAISSWRCLKIGYKAVTSGYSKRIVEPYFIIFRGKAFYFVAWCRNRARADVTDEISRRLRVVRVKANQQAVEWPDWMDHAEGGLSVPVIGRDLAAYNELEDPASLRRIGHRGIRSTYTHRNANG